MTFSVVIPCLNGAETIEQQLEALASQQSPWPWEIIVADNGSTDGTLTIVRRYMDRLQNLRIVDASDRRGQPHALNVGAHAARGDALLFCDADDEVAPGWLAAMSAALTTHEFVACRIEPRKLNEPWVCASRGEPQKDELQRLPYPPYFLHAGGGTLGIHRSLFESVGGFDESLPAYHDTYLCVQMQLAGKTLHFVPEGAVHVRFRDTFRGMYRQGRTYGEYSALLYKKSLALGTPKIPRSLKTGLSQWKELYGELRGIRSKAGCARVVWKLGYRMGRLRGSIKHRVLVL